jgi:hypothetical protein
LGLAAHRAAIQGRRHDGPPRLGEGLPGGVSLLTAVVRHLPNLVSRGRPA